MGAYKITCNTVGCKNYIIGKFGFSELAKKHKWRPAEGINNSYLCPDHQPGKHNKTFGKSVIGKTIEKKDEKEDSEK